MHFLFCWLKALGMIIAPFLVAIAVIGPLALLVMWVSEEYGDGWAVGTLLTVIILSISLIIAVAECNK